MKLYFAGQHPDIEFQTIALRAIQPVLNGAVLADAQCELVQQGKNEIVLRYNLAVSDGTLLVAWTRADSSRAQMRYRIENVPNDLVLDSFGIHFACVEGVRAFFRNGYFSWDGSEYVQADAANNVVGYAMTQLLSNDGDANVVIGFERHDRFQQTFTFNTFEVGDGGIVQDRAGFRASLTIQTLWDRKTRGFDERRVQRMCESETLVLFERERVEDALREWAQRVAAHSPVPPRQVERITGWCSWYNLYASITEENILTHLRGAQNIAGREQLPMRVFQIDDGFTPEMGDWLDVKPQFPRGMKPLLDDIRAAGFVPGLWIAPFVVGNRSHLFRAHPDWVVRERATGQPLAQMKFYDEFRWHKRSEEYYILDATHPDAFEYLRHVFRVWCNEWGCGYFKTDFMQFGSEHGADRARYHSEGMTRIEIWRRVAAMIREEIGDAMWLGCGCPLWASVGLVDAVRIGRDVGVTWDGERASKSLLRDGATRNFANGILWQADPDCILLREQFHYLSDAEMSALALFGGLLGGVLTTSDALDELSAERLRLWKFLLETNATCRFPLLGQFDKAVLVQVCYGKQFDAVHVLNTGEQNVAVAVDWTRFGLPTPHSLYDWNAHVPIEVNSPVVVSLPRHASKLFVLNNADSQTHTS